MCDQGIKDHKTSDRMNRTGHVAPANRAKREILPVATDTGRVYNGSAGKKVGALTGKEKGTCDGVDLERLILNEFQQLNDQEKIDFLFSFCSSFGAAQEGILFDQQSELKQNP